MTEDNFTLTTFYTSWQQYQEHLKQSLAPLSAEPALHRQACRAYYRLL